MSDTGSMECVIFPVRGENQTPEHVLWLADQVFNGLLKDVKADMAVPVMNGILNSLCLHVPDMETAVSVIDHAPKLIYDSIQMWRSGSKDPDTMLS